MTEYTPYQEGQSISQRYAWWASREIGHENPNIDAYAVLLTQEYQKLENGEITIEEFETNTPKISEETPLNYIRDRIIEWFPN